MLKQKPHVKAHQNKPYLINGLTANTLFNASSEMPMKKPVPLAIY
jgi:hypothetical protein